MKFGGMKFKIFHVNPMPKLPQFLKIWNFTGKLKFRGIKIKIFYDNPIAKLPQFIFSPVKSLSFFKFIFFKRFHFK